MSNRFNGFPRAGKPTGITARAARQMEGTSQFSDNRICRVPQGHFDNSPAFQRRDSTPS